jgi:hypothetical protein
MKLQQAAPPDEGGSLSVVYACPVCSQKIAMLTNSHETQLVQSLGVKIGPAGEAEGAKCPFSGMLEEMEEKAQVTGVVWTAAALERLERIPAFVRPMARQGIEQYAKSAGHREIDEEVLEQARGQFGM